MKFFIKIRVWKKIKPYKFFIDNTISSKQTNFGTHEENLSGVWCCYQRIHRWVGSCVVSAGCSCVGWSGLHGCPAGPPPPPTLVPGVASLAEAGPQPHCHITPQCSQWGIRPAAWDITAQTTGRQHAAAISEPVQHTERENKEVGLQSGKYSTLTFKRP